MSYYLQEVLLGDIVHTAATSAGMRSRAPKTRQADG